MIGLAALLLVTAAQRPPAADSVDRFVVAEMRRQRVPGLGLAVISRGRVIKARGYGFANLELRVPATDSTMFQSGSVGKQFTAAGSCCWSKTASSSWMMRSRNISPKGIPSGTASRCATC